jgi:hypothetical protein
VPASVESETAQRAEQQSCRNNGDGLVEADCAAHNTVRVKNSLAVASRAAANLNVATDPLYQLFGRDYQNGPPRNALDPSPDTREATVSPPLKSAPSLDEKQAIVLVLPLSLGRWAMIWGLLLAIRYALAL